MGNILEVKHLTKVFGKKQKAALEMVKQGKSKTEILKKPAQQLVSTMLILMLKKEKSSLLWGFQEVVNQHLFECSTV